MQYCDLEDANNRLEKARQMGAQSRWVEANLLMRGAGPALYRLPEGIYFLAETYVRTSQLALARETALCALEAFRTIGQTPGVISTTTLLGIIAFQEGQLQEACQQFLTAAEAAAVVGDHAMTCRLWNNLGAVHTLAERYPDAIGCYEKALGACAFAPNANVEAETLQNLGVLHRRSGNLDHAEECFVRAGRAAQSVDNVRQVAFALVERAHVALRRNDLATAERVGRMALIRFDTIGNSAGVGEAYKVFGMIMRERGSYTEAQEFLERARSSARTAESALLLAEIDFELGLVLEECGDVEEAERRFLDAAAAFDRIGAATERDSARTHLAAGRGREVPASC